MPKAATIRSKKLKEQKPKVLEQVKPKKKPVKTLKNASKKKTIKSAE